MGFKLLFEPKAKILHYGIPPETNFKTYMQSERKMGRDHYTALKTYNRVHGRIPTNKYLLLFFFPFLFILRTTREIYKLMSVRHFRRRFFSFILVVCLGGFTWTFSYLTTACNDKNKYSKIQ